MNCTPLRLSLFSLLALSLSCASTPSTSAPAEATQEAPLVGPPQVAWKDMTFEQRARWMDKVVTPRMQVLFQQFDPQEFATFNCKTCHGAGADDKTFKMPAKDLPELPGPDRFIKVMNEKPEWPRWVKFMGEQVTPQMAEMLGVPHYDPTKKDNPADAFSCAHCHPVEKS